MCFDFSELFSSSALGVLRGHTFFDDLPTLSFTLRLLKKAIADLESRDCTLSDCLIGLVRLGAAIKKLLDTDHRTFRRQSIAISQ